MELIKNIKKNTIFLLSITILILVVILKDDYKKILNALSSMDVRFIVLAAVFFFLSISFKASVNYLTINNKEKISLKEAIKHEIITQFFNGITPFSTGGQPMEIYMISRHDIKLVEATNISIQNFIFYQTALVIYGIIAVCLNFFFHILKRNIILRKFVLLGFFINSLVAIGLLLILISDKFTKKISSFFISLLYKLRIIKDKDKFQSKVFKKLDEFHESALSIQKRKGLFIRGVLLNLLSLTCLYIVPLFVVYSLGDFSSLNPLETLTSSAYVLLIGSFVPIPGASGGIEYGFLQFYGNFLNSNILSAVLIVWRFITYYMGMIIGALTFSMEKKEK